MTAWVSTRRRILLLGLLTLALLASLPAAAAQADPPANDDFAAAMVLTAGAPNPQASGSTVTATAEPQEPAHYATAHNSVWFRYTPTTTYQARLDTCGSGFDTTLAVYTGSALTSLTKIAVNDDSCDLQSSVSVAVTAGTTYWIALDGYSTQSGSYVLNLDAPPPLVGDSRASTGLYLYDEVPIFGSNVGASLEPDEPQHAGQAGGHSIWARLQVTAGVPVVIDACDSNFDTLLAIYDSGYGGLQEVASNDDTAGCGPGGTGSVVRFTPGSSRGLWVAIDGKAGATGSFTLRTMSNDDRAGALYVDTDAFATSYSNRFATTGSGEPGAGAVWFQAYASAGERFTVDTCATQSGGPDTAITVYQAGYGGLQELGSATNTPGCGASGTGARVTVTPSVAGTLYVAVSRETSTTGLFALRVSRTPANDARAGAAFLPTTPSTVGASNVGATKEPGEPNHAGQPGGASVWYRWQPAPGQRRVRVCGSGFSPLVAVYTQGYGGLTEVVSAVSVAGCAEVVFTAQLAQEYLIAVDGTGGGSGSFTLEFNPSNDAFAAAQSLSSFPVSGSTTGATAEPGEPAHGGTAAGHSVWYRIDPGVIYSSGRARGLDLCASGTSQPRLAVYRGSSVATLQSVTTTQRTTAVPSCPPGSTATRVTWRVADAAVSDTFWIAVDAADPGVGAFQLLRRDPPSNEDRVDAAQLYVGSTWYGTTVGASRESGEPDHAGAGGSASVWYQWDATSSAQTRLSLCSSPTYSGSYDAAMAIYTDGYGGLQEVASSDGTPGCGDGTQPRLTFTPTPGTRYYIAVDGHGPATGNFVLRLRQRPVNDDRQNPTDLNSNYYGQISGSVDLATMEPGEPNHAGVTGGHSVWYRWHAVSSQAETFDTCDTYLTEIDSVLAVYTTAYGGLQEVASNDDSAGCGPSGHGSRVTFNAVAGSDYLIAVDGKNGTQGDFLLGYPPSNDHLEGATVSTSGTLGVSMSLVRATADPGEPQHAGTAARNSVWYDWRPPRTALATAETCSTSSAARAAVYTGETLAALTPVSTQAGSACPAGQTGSRIRFLAIAGTSYKIALDSTTATSYGSLQVRMAPVNDVLASAQSLGSTSSTTVFGTTVDTGLEPGEPDHAGSGGTASVWYRWSAPWSGTVRFETCDSAGFDTALAMYRQDAPGMAGLVPVAANDDTAGCGPDGKRSRLRARVIAGTTYIVAVAGHGAVSGTFDLAVRMGPFNDDLVNATALSSGTSGYGATTVDAGHEPGEPDHLGSGADHSTWWRFTLGSQRNAAVRVCPTGGAQIPTVAVYAAPYPTPMATLAQQTAVGTTTVDAGCRRVALRRATGHHYFVIDGGSAGDQGAFTVSFAEAPANDDQQSAQTVSGTGTVNGTTFAATREDGELTHAGQTGQGSVWYRWTPVVSGPVEIDVCNAAFDSVIALYRPGQAGALEEVASSDDAANCGTGGSRITTTLTAGTTYLLAVDRKSGEGGFTLGFPPANDHFESPDVLSGQIVSRSGSTVRATPQPSEPAHAGEAAARSVWYSWTPPYSGRATVSTCLASSAPTRIALYTGTQVAALTPGDTSGPVAGCANGQGARVRTRVTGGTTYRIAVDAAAGSAFTLQLTLAPANDDRADARVVTAPSIQTGSTDYATAEDAETAHAGRAATASVWFRLTATADGPIALKTCGSSFDTVLAVYQADGTPVTASDEGTGSCGATSHRADVSFAATQGSTYYVALDGRNGVTGTYELAVGSPPNDDVEDAEVLPSDHASGVASNIAATTQLIEPRDVYPAGQRSVWWQWTAPATETVELNTCGTGFYTGLHVYTGTPASLTRVASSIVGGGCSISSRLTVAAQQGTTYRIQVSSYYATDMGPVRLQVRPPSNDRFAAARLLSGLDDQNDGTIAGASREDSEPSHGNQAAGRTIWYRWVAPSDGRLTLDTCGSPTAALVAAYRGIALGALTSMSPNGDQAACPGASPGRSGTYAVAQGTEYRFAVDGSGAAIGATRLRLHLAIDTTPPVTSFDSAPPARTRAATQQFTFSANEPSTFECSLDGATFAACTSPVSRSGLAEGVHVFRVRGTDQAGNLELDPASTTFTIDRTPPVVAVDSGPPARTASTSATLAFSSPESGATFECSLDGEAFASCSSPFARAGLTDRLHDFRVRASDDVGNVGAAATTSFTVDTRAPVTSFTSGPPTVTNDTSAQIVFQTDEQNTTSQCSVDGGAFQACTSPVTLNGLTEGDHAIRVRSTDDVGNAESPGPQRAWRLDLAAPDTSASAAPTDPVASSPAFSLTSTEAPALFDCAVDGGGFQACTSPYHPSVTGDGEHVVRMRARDQAGNTDATPEQRTFTLDTTAPEATITTGPTGAIGVTSATFTFTASESVRRFECAVDGGFSTCASPLTVNSLTEGQHQFRVRAVDIAGNVGAAATRTIIVDQQPPLTHFTTRPPDPTNAEIPVFGFASEPGATFECALDDAVPAPCTPPVQLLSLAEGDHHFRVRATDAAGNVEAQALDYLFEVDRTPPDTTITVAPDGPVHDEAPFTFTSTEDGHFECTFDNETWFSCGGDPSHPFSLPLTGRPPGAHVFKVRAVDAAGNADPTPAQHGITIVNEAPTAALDVTPDGGAASLEVAATIGSNDPDGDAVDYAIDFGDGTRQSGTLPRQQPLEHVYDRVGVYVIRLEVSDGFESAIVTKSITVVLPEPLEAQAGDDLVAVAGDPVTLDGGGSRPLRGIEQYTWDFGDGTSGEGTVVEHTYAAPGTYEARLTTEAGTQSDTDTATVRVVAPSPDFADILVRSGGSPLGGADVLVVLPDGQRIAAVSGADGHAKLRGLPDGAHRVLAYKTGYLPTGVNASTQGGRGSATIDLTAGDVAKAEVDSRPLSLQEILDLGIDPNDPANQHVFEFTVNLQVGDEPVTFTGHGSGGGGAGGFGGGFIAGSSGGMTCRRLVCKAQTTAGTVWVTYDEPEPGVPTLTTLVIPFRAKWLKEFFEVGMTVTNLADPEFVLRNGQAMLSLPPGLSLAPTARGEHLTVPLPDIPGGQEQRATWIVRGDTEGFYNLDATYGATLAPFNRSVTLRGAMEDPLHVWGGSALQLVVDVDKQVADTYPMSLRVGLKNVADVPVYNPSVELLKEGRHGYIEQPRQQREFSATEIAPGDTFSAGPFIIVPQDTGVVDLARSFIRKVAGDVDLQSSIVTHDRVPTIAETPVVTGHRRSGGRIVLQWPKVAGTTEDLLYSTPDRLTDPGPGPRQVRTLRAPSSEVTKVMVTDTTSPWFAVSSTLGNRGTMVHPLVNSASLPVQDLESSVPATTACRETEVPINFEDPDFRLTRWEYSINGGAWVEGGQLSGTSAAAKVPLPPGNAAITYRVRLYNEDGEVREQQGARSVCTSAWPKVEIDDGGLNCSDGSGTVVLKAKADPDHPVGIKEISFVAGSRAARTEPGSSFSVDYGPSGSYRMRTGGEVLRAAARDANGEVGEVAIKGLCPSYVDNGQLPPPRVEPQAKGTVGGPAPKPAPGSQCKRVPGLDEDAAGLDAKVKLGAIPVRLSAKCVFRWGAEKNTWVLTDGKVRVSGVDFEPQGPTAAGKGKPQFPGIANAIIIRAGDGGSEPSLMTLGRYAMKYGDMTITTLPDLEIRGRTFRTHLNELVNPNLKGLKPGRAASADISFGKDTATIQVGFTAEQLGAKFTNVALNLTASVSWASGLQQASVRVGVQGQVAEIIDLKGELLLRARPGHLVFGGDLQATFGAAAKKLVGISSDLSFSIADGRLERAAATVAKQLNPPKPLGTPWVLLRSIALDLGYEKQGQNSSLSFGGRLGFTGAGLNVKGISGLALVDGELGLNYSLNENSSDAIRLEGEARLLYGQLNGHEAWAGTVDGETTLRFAGFLDLQGAFTLQPKIFEGTMLAELKATGSLFGWFDATGSPFRFSIEGEGNISIPGFSRSGKVKVSTKGAGACADVKIFGVHAASLGAVLVWKDSSVELTCDFESIKESPSAAELFPPAKSARAAQAPPASGTMKTTIPKGTQSVGYVFTGATAMPRVVVSGPGVSFDTGAPPAQDPRFIVLPNPVSKQVVVIMAGPVAGDYTFTPSTPVAKVARSFGMDAPRIRVAVSSRQDGSATLRYRATGLGGRRLSFIERGGPVTRTIGRAKGERGTFTYRPAEGVPGKRVIYAVYGRNDTVVAVGRYRYRGPTAAARPGRITASLGVKGLTLKVGKSAGKPLGYRFIVVSGKRRFKEFVDPGRRSVTVPMIVKGQRVRVTVLALNEIRRPSVPRTRTVVAGRR